MPLMSPRPRLAVLLIAVVAHLLTPFAAWAWTGADPSRDAFCSVNTPAQERSGVPPAAPRTAHDFSNCSLCSAGDCSPALPAPALVRTWDFAAAVVPHARSLPIAPHARHSLPPARGPPTRV
jgi:hypothetical protein